MNPVKSFPQLLASIVCCAFLIAGCSGSAEMTTPEPAASAEAMPEVAAEPTPVTPPRSTITAMQSESASAAYDTVRAGRFDNGRMWTFEYPPTEYFAEAYGFTPDDAWFERARLGALRIPGCTASFVSPNGLVMTNHHCGRGNVAQLSTGDEDYLANGFFAHDLADELPAPGMYADQLIAIEDVTDEVTAALDAAETDAERQMAQQGIMQAIQDRLQMASASEGDSIMVQVISLYQGGRFSAYTFRRYTDMRLVMAPELKAGKFGGDPDNFTFPRYSLDMTYFRVYDNDAPLQTDFYFPFNPEGSSPGEAVFVIGNPGSTNRLESMAQLEYRRDVQEKNILQFISSRLDALRAEYAESPDPQLLSQTLSLSNADKLYRGRVRGLNNPIIMAKRADTERQFVEAIAADAELTATYGDLLARIEDVQMQKRTFAAEYGAFLGLQPQSGNASATMRRAVLAAPYLQQLEGGASADALEGIVEQIRGISDLPAAREQRFLAIRLAEFEQYLGDIPQVQALLEGTNPKAAAQMILENSVLATAESTAEALANGTLTMDDPAIQWANSVAERRYAFLSGFSGLGAQEQELNRIRGRAQYDVYGTTIPPDATFSLRLSDGVVQGYEYNGTVAPPYTTIYGLYDHYYSYRNTDDAGEWSLPDSWLNAPETLDRSTPFNLVTTNDIIGGNSGSPLLNQDLQVVGLVFDGNVEFLPSAFIFTLDLGARTVAVDARGMLEALDEVYDMDRVVYELTTGTLVGTEAEADEAMAN